MDPEVRAIRSATIGSSFSRGTVDHVGELVAQAHEAAQMIQRSTPGRPILWKIMPIGQAGVFVGDDDQPVRLDDAGHLAQRPDRVAEVVEAPRRSARCRTCCRGRAATRPRPRAAARCGRRVCGGSRGNCTIEMSLPKTSQSGGISGRFEPSPMATSSSRVPDRLGRCFRTLRARPAMRRH